MKPQGLFVFFVCAAAALAQQTAPPAKAPFAGFGNTGLDRKPPGRTAMPSAFPSMPVATTTPPVPAATTDSGSGGIALANDWAGHVTQGAGGQTMKIDDLRALLSPYGIAEADIAAHPEVTIYEGARPGGAPGETCRITYLMPVDRAERLLLNNPGIVTGGRAVAPGFPDGLFLRIYDIKAGIYNRLTLLTDSAKPVAQVVALQFKAENVNWYPPSPPFRKLNRDWHVVDYINTVNKGQPGLVIDTRVNDLRARGFLVINTTGGFAPDPIPEPGIVVKPARSSPKQAVTWYAPVPLVKLILFCLARQAER